MKTKIKQSKRGNRSQPSPRRKVDRSLNSDEQNRITNASADEDDNQSAEYPSERYEREEDEGRERKRTQEEDDEEN